MTAQYYSITYVSVASEDIAEFERKETTYWSKVKKAAIDRGEQNLWLWHRKSRYTQAIMTLIMPLLMAIHLLKL